MQVRTSAQKKRAWLSVLVTSTLNPAIDDAHVNAEIARFLKQSGARLNNTDIEDIACKRVPRVISSPVREM
jgi:hypothetical protein